MKKLSVIIVTYNSQTDILNCIQSILETSDLPNDQLEVIVVDNSDEKTFIETQDLIRNKYGDIIIVIHNEKNGGYGQGNNVGIDLAKAPIVCVINPDVILKVPVFGLVTDLFKNDRNLAMIGGKQIGGRNISFWIKPEYDYFIFTAPISKLLNVFSIYFQKFFYLSGALLFLDKDKFLEIGKFDESMFMYCEEADITNRFITKKYATSYQRKIEYLHLIDDRKEASDSHIKMMLDSCVIYFAKHKFSLDSFLNRRIISIKIMRCLGILLNRKKMTEKYQKYLAIFQKYKN